MEREKIRGEDRGIQRERRREGIRQVGGWEEGRRREEEGGGGGMRQGTHWVYKISVQAVAKLADSGRNLVEHNLLSPAIW